MRSVSNLGRGSVSFNMTPMIDVVFLLIIFFLCIDFKTLEAKLPAFLPKDRGGHTTYCLEEQLSVKIVCQQWGHEQPRYPGRADLPHRLVGHRTHWFVNARRFDDAEKMRLSLTGIAADPTRRVLDPKMPGRKRLMSVVVEPGVGAVYGDVARTVDLVRAAGFDDVQFGGAGGKR